MTLRSYQDKTWTEPTCAKRISGIGSLALFAHSGEPQGTNRVRGTSGVETH